MDRMNVNSPRIALFGSLILAFFLFRTDSDGAERKAVTEAVMPLLAPLVETLDFETFNPPEGEKSDRIRGEILSRFDEFLLAQGISPEYGEESYAALRELIRNDYGLVKSREMYLDDQYDALKKDLEELEDDLEEGKKKADLAAYLALKSRSDSLRKRRNVFRPYLEFERPLLARFERADSTPADSRLRAETYSIGIRVLYSLLSDDYLSTYEKGDPLEQSRREKREIAKLFVRRSEFNATRYLNIPTSNIPVGRFNSGKEAANLIVSESEDRFATNQEIAKRSHAEVSALDVSPEDPMWNTHAKMESGHVDTWSKIEQWIEQKVSEDLLDSKKFRKDHPAFHYDLDFARRVLFWDDVKTSATSPKIETVDALGQKWKLKWGEEATVEPVSNRLRLMLGAKFSDLTYTSIDGDSHLLILPSALEKSMNPDKEMPLTRAEFVRTMKESRYEFNIEPFLLSSGKITEENADEVLAGLPDEALKRYRKKKLIGRVWIRFRESMVEGQHEVITSGGPVSTHSLAVQRDRSMRQSMIMSFLLSQTDVKEDNFRSAWIEDFDGRKGPQYFEYFHDPGSSLGGARRAGEVNRMGCKFGTAEFLWFFPGGNVVTSDAFSFYRPGQFDQVTFADQRSGARHIARLSSADIRTAVAASEMPDFYQEALVWRLLKRRDLIAKIYDLPLPDARGGKAPETEIVLTTRADRIAAASRYRIPLVEIEKDLVRTGFLTEANRAGKTSEPFVDRIVVAGEIQPYNDTVIPGILREFRYPSGFVDRITRFDDGEAWQTKRFRMEED
jgi:hypothetical protein